MFDQILKTSTIKKIIAPDYYAVCLFTAIFFIDLEVMKAFKAWHD